MYCIYLLRNVSGLGYVGSTKSLKARLRGHRYDAKHDRSYSCSSKQLFIEEVKAEVLEEVETKEEARIRERHYIESLPNLVNVRKSFQTEEEEIEQTRQYREANREHILHRQREYDEVNREKILRRQREYREANREELNRKKREKRLASKQ
jgi:predicted GIY-YIG superfamily endonuclease